MSNRKEHDIKHVNDDNHGIDDTLFNRPEFKHARVHNTRDGAE